ncbi:sensor histidine kinase [Aquibium microcysteis]|uniref:sensor histidine kinase n=1 Tax=Aquibium microcysteis TaxID=675281 RepID=UPI00165D219D|nr:PAS domain-containing sensor histidine kinase [Aquibium microcysteis]
MQLVRPRDSGIGGSCFATRAARTKAVRETLRAGAAGVASLAGSLCLATPGAAQERVGVAGARVLGGFGAFEVIQFATFAGVLGAALVSAVWLIRERGRIAAENLQLRERIAELNASVQRSDALASVRDQRTVVWSSEHRRPEILGSLPTSPGVPDERSAFLAFGRWLTAGSATAIENAISSLRNAGEPFDLVAETRSGIVLEVQGRKAGSHSIVRFQSLTERQREHARLRAEHASVAAEHDLVLKLLNALEMPFWVRDSAGRLQHANEAYAIAVEAETPGQAIAEGRELLGTQAREAVTRHHATDPVYQQTVSAVIGGDRRLFAVTDVATGFGAAGLAVDRSEVETLRGEFERMMRSHSETLDQLNTAVATFDAEQKLRFFNQAFQKLWQFEPGFLESAPDNTLMLDRLRSAGKLAEQPEWRRWKENLLSAYRSVDPQEHWWHLPDGRTIRVVGNPSPRGGVTWVFENLTERFDLESRYNTAVRVQGETLDNLAEGVAVFGPDGRVRLFNPAFARLWRLGGDEVGVGIHIAVIRKACERACVQSPWPDFVAAVTGFDEERRETHGKVELVDGSILSHAVIPLPNGQVMTTFVDVTDSVNFERALQEKNEALQKADQLKNDFVQHVSYELRSPLTNIIGFTELLQQPDTGPMSPRQQDYLDHIASSSSVLLTIVNDILDLATVDAGIMELEIGEVPVARTVNETAELVAEKLREHDIALRIDLAAAPAAFQADGQRLRQILFNLLSNAANYAPEHSTIVLSCRQKDDRIEFLVHDDGPGMPPEILDAAFKRFEPRANGGRKRGAGLGLAIVKSFVELHGGTVEIDSGRSRGTTVLCRFPAAPREAKAAE